jgi:hypothetical protein
MWVDNKPVTEEEKYSRLCQELNATVELAGILCHPSFQ